MRQREPCPSTPRSLGSSSSRRIASGCTSNYLLLKQASFGDHDDVASVQRDIAFKILTGLVSAVVEHENVLARPATPSDHDAPLGRKGPKAPGERNRLHQCGWLADHIRARSEDLASDENLGLEIFLRDGGVGQSHRDVQAL